jgi:hypothetical protein
MFHPSSYMLAAGAGPCTSMRNTVEWATIIPQSIWQEFDDMTTPGGPAGTPRYNSFCVSHVHLGGDKPGCKLIQHRGLNTPDEYETRDRLMERYPGSTLQAPACRAIAANLMRLNRTGLPASHLLSRLGLNITVHNAMNGECSHNESHCCCQHTVCVVCGVCCACLRHCKPHAPSPVQQLAW